MITYEEIIATGLPLSDHGAIAEALSVGRTELVKTEIGKLSILGAIGMETGNTLLDTIDTVPDFRHVRYPLANGWLDVADPTVRYMLDTLCSPEDATKIKNLAVRPVVVTPYEVAITIERG
jgi:hypothetical protein